MTTHLDTAPMGITAQPQPAGLRARRYALVAMPVLAGLCLTLAAAMDPAAGISGDTMFQEYAEHPDPLQIKSLAYHWAYAFWIGIALVVASLVRHRGVWLANIAAVLAFAGMTTLPGMLFIDWIDSAAGQLWGTEGVNALHDRMEEISWGMPYFQLPGFLGFALALPLAAFALQRAGLVRWYAPAATLGALLAFMVSNATWPGCVVATACFVVLSVELWRGTR